MFENSETVAMEERLHHFRQSPEDAVMVRPTGQGLGLLTLRPCCGGDVVYREPPIRAVFDSVSSRLVVMCKWCHQYCGNQTLQRDRVASKMTVPEEDFEIQFCSDSCKEEYSNSKWAECTRLHFADMLALKAAACQLDIRLWLAILMLLEGEKYENELKFFVGPKWSDLPKSKEGNSDMFKRLFKDISWLPFTFQQVDSVAGILASVNVSMEVDYLLTGLEPNATFLISRLTRILQLLNVDGVDVSSGAPIVPCHGSGLYRLTSCCNHSCDPNCELSYENLNEAIVTVRAKRDLNAGEEVLISYINESGAPIWARQQQLARLFGFRCSCSKCLSDSTVSMPEWMNEKRDQKGS
eukprot:Protomagalhaensia_wolfi_Nauph_80__3643@NODE_367_length_2667_cov_16_683790_g277_i0_p1_GENE_NODE_367_length_2667_cov_16_683790_g277_i0NODE_367_length_2667_cov_16_683790_g277_i0_p1_ORF_typecomplete_len353_score48_91SET/PF00856_28/8e17Retro_M/PF02813_14/0_17DUF2116/PF09889_9/6e02DUF2116/PF09889_9/0_55DUF2116/PF09889_9/1_4e03_NODE_367_length_2667_cov_16_683790_g277_i05701628